MMKKGGAFKIRALGIQAAVSFNISWLWIGIAIYDFGADIHMPFTLVFISKYKKEK